MKIKIAELQAYKNATDEERQWKYFSPSYEFIIPFDGKVPEDEVAEYIRHRGKQLKYKSLRTELSHYRVWSKYAYTVGIECNSFRDCNIQNEIRKYKRWLMKHGYKLAIKRKKHGKYVLTESPTIGYYRQMLRFYNRGDSKMKYEKDIWELDKLDFSVKQNPIKYASTISFTSILQENIREEVKKIIIIQLRNRAVGTVQSEIISISHFSIFLKSHYAEVNSLKDISRDMIEDYLLEINISGKKKSYHSELSHLRTVLGLAGKIYGYDNLHNIMIDDDIPKSAKKLYRSYTDAEVARLNKAIIGADPQIGRAWILQGLLGLRISETLSLTSDCILDNNSIIVIQTKTSRAYVKKVNNDVIKIIQRSTEYTKNLYGERKYIFVSQRNPDHPLPYGTFRDCIDKIIADYDLKDDNGQLFRPETHILRHTYGRRLADLGYDDSVIAELLGHAGMSTVHCYRRISDDYLQEETKAFRDRKDHVLKEIIEGW